MQIRYVLCVSTDRRKKRPRPNSIRTIQSRVNQCLDNPSDSAVSSAHDTPALDFVTESHRVELGVGKERGRVEPGVATAEKGRVLLLDDDPELREIITAFLAENGYKVVPVQNGGEGVREVLASDYAMVLCDFNMPGLPGDLFYRAVERIRPDLCRRFVFMTGHRDDAKTNNFIREINGFVLWKPFQLKELQDAIILLEVRCAFQSVFDGAATDPGVSHTANVLLTGGSSHPEGASMAAKVAAILARAQSVPVRKPPSGVRPASEPEVRAGGVSYGLVLAGLVLLLVLGGRAWNGYAGALERVETASAKRLALQAQWSALSPDLDAVIAVRPKIATDENRLARMSAYRISPRWTTVLRLAEAGVEILEIHAGVGLDDSGVCAARIRGVAGGPEPRLLADRFRQAVEKNLNERAEGRSVKARFEEIADVPGAVAGEKSVAFVVIATIESSEPSVVARREER